MQGEGSVSICHLAAGPIKTLQVTYKSSSPCPVPALLGNEALYGQFALLAAWRKGTITNADPRNPKP